MLVQPFDLLNENEFDSEFVLRKRSCKYHKRPRCGPQLWWEQLHLMAADLEHQEEAQPPEPDPDQPMGS